MLSIGDSIRLLSHKVVPHQVVGHRVRLVSDARSKLHLAQSVVQGLIRDDGMHSIQQNVSKEDQVGLEIYGTFAGKGVFEGVGPVPVETRPWTRDKAKEIPSPGETRHCHGMV